MKSTRVFFARRSFVSDSRAPIWLLVVVAWASVVTPLYGQTQAVIQSEQSAGTSGYTEGLGVTQGQSLPGRPGLKPDSPESVYRGAEALRHPNAAVRSHLSAGKAECLADASAMTEAMPFQNNSGDGGNRSFPKCTGDQIGERSSDSRVQELEERVRRLEGLVATLVEAQRSAEAVSPERARLLLAGLSGGDWESGRAQAAELRNDDGDLGARNPPHAAATGSRLPQELLPNLGKIGATASFRAGLNSGPFGLNTGSFFGGAIELPLALVPGGRLNYEISLGLAQTSRTLAVTSNVAQVSNLAVLTALNPGNGTENIQEALLGTGDSPFPVTSSAKWRVQVLELVPFALKYNSTLLDRWRVRPYAVLGLGTYVSVSNQLVGSGIRANSTLSAGTLQSLTSLLGPSPFGGSLIGGQIGLASQLGGQGVPAGQGGIDVGAHFGAGVEYRWTSGLSVALDARFNKVPVGLSYHTTTASWGWHF